MELAKITSKGQITLPVAIRKELGVKDGDKILFIQEGGRIVIMNASMAALSEAQRACVGLAEEFSLKDEQDVVDLIKEIRRERSREHENNV